MSRRRRYGLVLLIILVFLSLAVAGTAAYFTRRGLTDYDTTVMAVVGSEVTIYRDDLGIAHIYASDMEDLFFAQGYTQAQDRIWQMDLTRRAVAGRLSEIFGKDLIDTDFFLRSLLMRHSAEEAVSYLSPESRRLLERYAAGVNAYIEDNIKNLPPEFLILGYTPEAWTVADSLGIGKYMAWDLGGNMNTELFLAAAMDILPSAKVRELFPTYPFDGLTIIPEEALAKERLKGDENTAGIYLALLDMVNSLRLGVPGQELGSNNWVVGGNKTASGKPLLANDMHLKMGIPSIWYQTRLEIPGDLILSGIIFPGIPGIIVGTNGKVAWGVTNVGPDVQDLYRERRHPENPYLFEFNGEWEQARVLKEYIHVKGQKEPVVKEIIITRNGPLISEAMEDMAGLDEPLSMRWTAHDVTRELDCVMSFARATNWEEFKIALDLFHVPAQSFVFADKEGNIAYRANGRIPIRLKGEGLLPAPGWDPDYQWSGFIPYDELPTLYNPAEGFVATANHKVVPDSYPYFITYQWAPPYRAEAIRNSLLGRSGLTVMDMKEIQFNVDNYQARLLKPVIENSLSGQPFTGKEAEALEVFLDWLKDPTDEADEAGPAIYHTFYIKALAETFAEEMGEELYTQFLRGPVVNTFDSMLLNGSIWFDEAESGKVGILRRAFVKTVAELDKILEGKPENWQWGRLHQIHLKHQLSQVPLLGRFLDDGPYAQRGSHVTAAAASFSSTDPFMVRSSAPWRYVADLADLGGNSWENLAGGVSGHPFSSHYRDQTAYWLEGKYTPIYLGTEKVRTLPGTKVTTLMPR
jgi:penicillin G amidase